MSGVSAVRQAMRRVATRAPATVRGMAGGAVANKTPPYKHMRGVVGAPSFSLRVSLDLNSAGCLVDGRRDRERRWAPQLLCWR